MKRGRRYNPGRWAIERERHRITDAQPAAEDRTASVGELLPALVRALRLDRRTWLDDLAEEWAELAGPEAAHHARPGRMERQRLIVFVDNSVWLNELVRYGRVRILRRLRERFGERIATVTFQLDPERGRQ